jgi:hypothetical protein
MDCVDRAILRQILFIQTRSRWIFGLAHRYGIDHWFFVLVDLKILPLSNAFVFDNFYSTR